MSDKFGEGCDLYFYSGFDIMCNWLNIYQQQWLEQVVYEMMVLCVVIIEFGLLVCGLLYLCIIYCQLYQDIFDWVG